ncbi:MAG: InlB B-repeat-containing protein [Paludibacteraceae bacterium]|nr:InlB B-repeat-containing protein [Paludibacteraceae bacterium]
MCVSAGGYYEYYECSLTDDWFNIGVYDPWSECSFACADPGFNGTDITAIVNDGGTCHVTNTSGNPTFYIIAWYPETTMNPNANFVICASSDLPDDTGSSCTAPSTASVSPTETAGWRYSLGETIDLTCTATGGSGSYTYQWQKYIGSSWTDINPATNASAATERLQIANCTTSDGGSYRCKVSTSSGCELISDGGSGYFIRVFTLYGGYQGGSFSHHKITWTNEYEGTVTINLNAASTYKFKFTDNDGKWYGNSGTITKDLAPNWGWGFGSNTANDATLTTGSYGSGEYVFTVNILHFDDSPSKYVNLRSVTYPKKTTYLQLCSDWKANEAKYAVYYWKGGDNGWTNFMDTYACNGDVRYVEIPVWATNCIFGRFDPSKGSTGNWDDEWNRTGDLTLSAANDYYHTLSKGGDNKYYGTWGTYTPPTYTITFNGNGSTGGSMSNMTGIVCGDDATLTTNGFTKTSEHFAGWNTAPDGSSISYANGATITNITENITLYAQWSGPVNIPGTVDKSNYTSVSGDMTWYGANDEYFDFGPTSGANLGRWAEWQVNVLSAGEYIVSVVVDFPAGTDGYQWKLQLLNGGGSDVVTAYESVKIWNRQEYTYSARWDLSGVTPGIYTLRVTNIFGWSQPKLKSVTLALAGLSLTYTKTPDEAEYGRTGDSHRATGTIKSNVVTTSGITAGASVSASGNVLTIGGVTITAPETEEGKLYYIPKDIDPRIPNDSDYVHASCTWRFDHWENVPATVTADVDDVIAVYIPTFPVEYELFGGTINDDPYYTWYRYTGRSTDSTPLPEDVTKEGYMFGGWYQNATTQLFTSLPGHYYGGYIGAWCLKAHWLLPCDEPQTLTKVTLTGSSTYETAGYNNKEYVGTPVISVSGGSEDYDLDGDSSDETGYELGTAGDLVFVTIKDGFRVGDIIRVAITATNTDGRISSSPNYLDLFFGTSAIDATKLTHLTEIRDPGIYEYTLSADDLDAIEAAGATSVGVYRMSGITGQNPCVYSVEVFGCRDLIFDDHNGTHIWSDPKNWAPNYVEIPSYSQATRILKPCVVNIANAQAMNVKLCKGIGNNGSLTINADAALSVRDEISEVHNKDFSTLYPVAASDLVILANASNQGAVAHGDTEGNTHATVQFYARGQNAPANTATWQYMGVPFSDVTRAQSHYYGAWMCEWIENTAGNAGSNWKWVENEDHLYPFVGYCLTQEAAMKYTNTGTLVPSTNKTLSLTYAGTTGYTGWNMFANSYMAPIQIANFIDGDFVGDVDKTIYLFNTGINKGNQTDWPDQDTELGNAGQYVAVPIHTAVYLNNNYIPPMQGFYLLCRSAGTTTVTLNYERLVRNIGGALSVNPTRAPKAEQTMPMLRIDVKGSHFSDKLYIFENEEQTNDFDNGWDGYKFEGETYAPQLMTHTSDLDLAVDVSPAFGGKRIAFRVGEDNEYTLHFSTTEQGLQLRDLKTNAVVDIVDGGEYSFMAFNTTSEERFEIIDNRQQIPNGIDEIPVDATGKILDMTVYTMDGRLVLHRTTDFNKPLGLPQNGTYIVYLTTTTGKHVHKIVF